MPEALTVKSDEEQRGGTCPRCGRALQKEYQRISDHYRYDCPIDYAVIVVAWICRYLTHDPLKECEVGSGHTLERAKEIAHKSSSARVVEAWQQHGLYHYGREVYRHGIDVSPHPMPVEVRAGYIWRRA
jgi:hypothetical protein